MPAVAAAAPQPTSHFLKQVVAQLGGAYVVVAFAEKVEMRLIVLVHARHAAAVAAVETAKSATGLAHVYGNKGGLVAKLSPRSRSVYHGDGTKYPVPMPSNV